MVLANELVDVPVEPLNPLFVVAALGLLGEPNEFLPWAVVPKDPDFPKLLEPGWLLAIWLLVDVELEVPVGLNDDEGVFRLVANWSLGGDFFQKAIELPRFCIVAHPVKPTTRQPSVQIEICFHPFRMTMPI